MNDFSRYSRQTQIEKIGLAGQQKLANASVLIVGAGGLGCAVGAHLAGAGVGKIDILDHDTVDLSNLHRQTLFRERDIGHSKAEIAARELSQLNSQISVRGYARRLSIETAKQMCQHADLVIDAADNFAVSYLLSDACTQFERPLLSASVNKTFGYIGVFCQGAPSFRAVFARLPTEHTSCETVGVTGPSVGIIASVQAQEALKLLTGQASLHGKLLYLDLWDYSQNLIDVSGASENQQRQVTLISSADIGESDWVIDVRNVAEIETRPQTFAVHLNHPLGDLLQSMPTLKKERRTVFACHSGQRAIIAAQTWLDQQSGEVAAVIPSD